MITPCNAENGCGIVSPVTSPAMQQPAPSRDLQFNQMTDVIPAQGSVMPSPSLGPASLPSQSGVIASTFPMPGIFPPAASDPPETIPGQPDPPFGQDTITGGSAVPPPVLPEAPQFQVPPNPLLPPGYQETISYENLQYLNGFLRTQIGKYMRVEQLIGSNLIEDRYGYLIGVGINYILLQELGTGNVSALDYYNIKFVHIYYSNFGLPTNSRR